MLVFGDSARTADPQEELARLVNSVRDHASLAPGLPRYTVITNAFIDAAELAQGIADAGFDAAGKDEHSPQADAAMDMVMVLAKALHLSWDDAPAHVFADFQSAATRLRLTPMPATVTCKQAEGYAFYALYPESFLKAAYELTASEPLQVVGIRSIGLGLSALVAAGHGAKRPLTVRPIGHPFQRELALSRELHTTLLGWRGDFAVVDEGPGLSGSSFGAVLDMLEEGGVARSRLHLFPSHRGDLGHHARTQHQTRWRKVKRHVVDFEDVILNPANPRKRLEAWFADMTGPRTAPLLDLCGGAWRTLRYSDERCWPPANIQQERRKYLLLSENGPWLLKFAGLGRYGQNKQRWTIPLAEAGFIARVEALRHGFTLERWIDDAQGLDIYPVERNALVEHLARYLGFRARDLLVGSHDGASLQSLAEMLRHNAGLALPDGIGPEFQRFLDQATTLQRKVRRVATDNRLHPWEWLRSPDGRLIKTDAVDHAATHDLVGCQDIAWDIAGATAEFNLAQDEVQALVRGIELVSGHAVDPALLRFLAPCYLAFHLGFATLASDSLGSVPAEAARLTAEAGRYRARLEQELGRVL